MNANDTLSQTLAKHLKSKSWMLALAESCTGGLMAETITRLPGSSQYFDCGVVSYSNDSKIKLLGVSPELLKEYGAVSQEVAMAMAQGLLERSSAQIGLSITGIAGPEGGSDTKPIGLVYFGLALRNTPPHYQEKHFQGDRQAIRNQAAHFALEYLLSSL